jgi:prevent-host-death family protein
MTTTMAVARSQPITAAEANRQFSKHLRGVGEGATYVVTSHGRPVARIEPVGPETVAAPDARVALFDRLRAQTGTDAGRWTRDDYEALTRAERISMARRDRYQRALLRGGPQRSGRGGGAGVARKLVPESR